MKNEAMAPMLAFALLACAVDTLPIATLDTSDGGESKDDDAGQGAGQGGRGHRGQFMACESNDDCATDAYCDKPACSAPVGACRPRPPACDAREQFEPACDGFTYFNRCLRERAGIAAATPDEYEAKRCGGPAGACPPGSFCARLLLPGALCLPDPPGTCWVLPKTCGDPREGGDRWNLCGATFANGGAKPAADPSDYPVACLDTCSAIRLELAFTPAPPDRCLN